MPRTIDLGTATVCGARTQEQLPGHPSTQNDRESGSKQASNDEHSTVRNVRASRKLLDGIQAAAFIEAQSNQAQKPSICLNTSVSSGRSKYPN
jgi:hypothetical protein